MMQTLQPPGWARPRGYSNAIAAKGTLVFVAGQVGWTPEGKWLARDFAGQFRQALANIIELVAQAGGGPQHIVRLTWFVVDKAEYEASLKGVGEAYRELMGRNYPTMTVVQVGGLVEDAARLEIEATAVVPDKGDPA